jgi:hypothetical protein
VTSFLMPKTLWVLKLEGAERFECALSGNPGIYHDGGTSVHQVFADALEIAKLVNLGRDLGVSIDPRVLSGRDDTLERRRLFQRPEEIQVPFRECLKCPWWDPVTLGEGKSCFLREAPQESAKVLLEYSPQHVAAAKACPQGNA